MWQDAHTGRSMSKPSPAKPTLVALLMFFVSFLLLMPLLGNYHIEATWWLPLIPSLALSTAAYWWQERAQRKSK